MSNEIAVRRWFRFWRNAKPFNPDWKTEEAKLFSECQLTPTEHSVLHYAIRAMQDEDANCNYYMKKEAV